MLEIKFYDTAKRELMEEAGRRKTFTDKRILYGTGNHGKLDAMRKCLEALDIEVLGLNDIKMTIPNVTEDGSTPLENARKKAFPLDSISIDIKTGKYFYDLDSEKLLRLTGGDGFSEFLKRYLL